MTQFIMKFNIDNASFHYEDGDAPSTVSASEINFIANQMHSYFKEDKDGVSRIKDSNGNTVGYCRIKEGGIPMADSEYLDE